MIKLVLNKKGQYCRKLIGAGRPHPINEDKLILELRSQLGISIEEIINMVNYAKQEAMEEHQQEANEEVKLDDIIKESKVFTKFFIVFNRITKSSTVYYDNDTKGQDYVCTLKDFTAETIEDYLSVYQRDMLRNLGDTLKPYINPKKTVSDRDMLDYCVNVLTPKTTLVLKEIDEDPHPVVVEGCDKFALRTIPFKHKDATLGDLNPFLKDFLLRVSRYEHLCAVLWTNFIGIKTPYVIYLEGPGGDGKSGFVDMLRNLVEGSFATFDMEKFNGFNMFNKSLLVLNENNSTHIMQNQIVKAVSGGDNMKIEGKGRDSFSGVIRGQIIIVSNHQPKIQGLDNETRRLCYYTVTKPLIDKDALLMPDRYKKELGATPNEFLNFCRQCYDKYKTIDGGVADPDNYADILTSLRDQEVAETNDKIILKLSEFFEFMPQEKILTVEIIKYIKEIDKNNKYAVSNFETCLYVDFGVKKEGKYYLGIGRK